jgi:hypothetical protein
MTAKYWDANCMGYALKRNRWVLPYARNEIFQWTKENWEDRIYEMVYNFGWRLVDKNQMVDGKTYVAFRWGKTDFHFMVRMPSGHWRHKQGMSDAKAVSRKEVFADTWSYGKYNSQLYIFEVL